MSMSIEKELVEERSGPRSGSARRILVTLFAGNFVLGTAETLVVGLLVVISRDLDVTVAAAGTLVTAYGVGMAVGGPLLTLAAMRLDRRTVVVGAIGVFVVGNLVAVAAGSFPVLLIARGVTGAVHGLFLAMAFTVATSVVPRGAAGRAMAAILLGNTLAGAFGSPLGAAVGQAVGWRGVFAVLAVLGVAVLVASWLFVPALPGARGDGAGAGPLRHAVAPRVLAVLAVCLLVFAAYGTAWSYIVPLLQDVTGITGPMIGVFLMINGAATALGAYVGGRLADWNAGRTLVLGLVVMTLSLVALRAVATDPVLVAVVLALLGASAMAMAPSMQHRVLTLAGPGAPVAQSLPASSANLGTALGALAGGAAIDRADVLAAVLLGAAIGVVGVAVAAAGARLRAPDA